MRIGDIMTAKVVTIAPKESAETAWQQMQTEEIRHLVVTDGGQIIGVISDRDLGGAEAVQARSGKTVTELMTREPVTTTPHATVREVANLLRGHTIGCLPVVDEGRLVGIVSTTDVLDLVGRGAERPVDQAKRWTLKHRGPRHQKSERPR
jgi:acetoin utilization protein AcuB